MKQRLLYLIFALVFLSQILVAQTNGSQENERMIQNLLSSENKIMGLELVIAEGASEQFYSKFGHALLRFVSADSGIFNDFVLSFEANMNNQSNISANQLIKKGLMGDFSIIPRVKNSSDFWQTYVLGENRSFRRAIIPSNFKIRHQVFMKLKEWIEHPEEMGPYTFLSNNCAGVLVKFLEQSGLPAIGGVRPRIPTSLPDWAAQGALAPYASLVVENNVDVYKKCAKLLGMGLDDFMTGNWPKSANEIFEKLNDTEIKKMNIAFGLRASPARMIMRKLMENHSYREGASLQDVMGFKRVAMEFYEICEEEVCAFHLIEREELTWNKEEVSYARRMRNINYGNIFIDKSTEPIYELTFEEDLSRAPKSLRQKIEYLQHLQLLLRVEKQINTSSSLNTPVKIDLFSQQ